MINDNVEYTIKNLNKEKIFKEIIKITPVCKIKCEGELIKFCVSSKYQAKIEKIIEKQSKLQGKQIKGFVGFLKNITNRLAIVITLLVFTILIFILNGFILKYEINGIQLIPYSQVEQILKNQNIDGIVSKKQVDIKLLETELQKLDKVSLVSVIIRGNTLVVNIKEKVYNAEYEDKNNFIPLVSKFDGIITEMTIIQGTPLVAIGQTVKKGQKLVAPYIINTNGELLSVNPMADIKADVFFSDVSEVPDVKIEYIQTGNFVVKRQLFFNNALIFNNEVTSPYKNYDFEKTIEYISNNNIFPIKLVKTKFYELTQVVHENYYENNKTAILEDVAKKTRQLFAEYEIIKEEYYNIETVAGNNIITYTCVVNCSIL